MLFQKRYLYCTTPNWLITCVQGNLTGDTVPAGTTVQYIYRTVDYLYLLGPWDCLWGRPWTLFLMTHATLQMHIKDAH